MRVASSFSIVSVTISNIKQAQALSKILLHQKLCACVHIVPSILSMYWWKGKLCKDREVWMIIKTHKSKIKKLFAMIQKNHPYDVPEILEIKLNRGSSKYLQWIEQSIL